MKRKWGVAAAAFTLAGPLLFVGATAPAHACGNPINPGPAGASGDPCPVGEQMINCLWAQNLSNGLIIAGPACQGGRRWTVRGPQYSVASGVLKSSVWPTSGPTVPLSDSSRGKAV
jgi:hypothetical protein